jgi:transposase
MSFDMHKIEQRAVIKFLTFERISVTQIHQRLVNAYGDSALSYPSVARWSKQFRLGRLSLMDNARYGRPITATSPENIARVEQIMTKDRRITLVELEDMTELSHGSLINILHEHLGLKKLCCMWIPHSLTEAQKQKRLECSEQNLKKINEDENFWSRLVISDETWIYTYDPDSKHREWRHGKSPPTKVVKPCKSSLKVMLTIFWDSMGLLMVDFLPPQTTMDGTHYASLIRKLKEEITKKRRGKLRLGILLLDDNARPHRSKDLQVPTHRASPVLSRFSTIRLLSVPKSEKVPPREKI